MVLKCTIKGIRPVHYTNKNGVVRSGIEIHLSYPDKDITGEGCFNMYVPRSQVGDRQLKLGETVQVLRDPYQRTASGAPYTAFIG